MRCEGSTETAASLWVVLTLALGVGANSAILRDQRNYAACIASSRPATTCAGGISRKTRCDIVCTGESFSYPLFSEFRKADQSFSDLSAFDSWDSFESSIGRITASRSGRTYKGQLVSANFFSMLGVNAVIGRTFAANEDSGSGGHPVAVISYATWEHDFARDPNVTGKKLLVRGTPLTVIGVAPRHFSGCDPGKSFGVWIP